MNDSVHPIFKPILDAIAPPMSEQDNLPSGSTIDVSLLIQKAEQLAYDGKLRIASSADIPVQILHDDSGRKYKISITASLMD